MSGKDELERVVRDFQAGIAGFAEEMKAKDIHVGMHGRNVGLGPQPRCVVCGEVWPCEQSGASLTFDEHALARVKEYCDRWETMGGLHPDLIHSIGTMDGILNLTVTDLRTLIRMAERDTAEFE